VPCEGRVISRRASLAARPAVREHRPVFRISDFSRLTRVTIKTLRHYDRLGLLAPAYVDPVTRYRWYSAAQVPRLHRIRALRDLGFSLEDVADILDQDPGAGALRRRLERRREEVGRQLAEDARRLAELDAALKELGQRGSIGIEAAVREIPPLFVAARRARVVELAHGAEELFEAVETDAAAARIRASGPPLLVYHDRDYREADADIEAAVPVAPDARTAGGSTLCTIPGHATAACVVYRGDYDQWARVGRDLLAWLEARHLVPAGPVREVFLQFPVRDAARLALPPQFIVSSREDLLTEMQIPVRVASNLR
jgi:DNA-binding transcriptional MerR regulator